MKVCITILTAIAVLMFSTLVNGQTPRYVVVNGVRLGNNEIGFLEQLACGPIPNGVYWLNYNTGIWGYGNDPRPQGRLTGNCYNSQQRNTQRGNTQKRKSLSERGLLYSPGELLR
jgi:hypothetical protein